jgi:hypothetical protein
MVSMARKKLVSFRIHEDLAKAFHETAKPYYGKLGLCFSAAVAMFIQADPRMQEQFIKRVFEAELSDEVEELLGQLKIEQFGRLKGRNHAPRLKTET